MELSRIKSLLIKTMPEIESDWDTKLEKDMQEPYVSLLSISLSGILL